MKEEKVTKYRSINRESLIGEHGLMVNFVAASFVPFVYARAHSLLKLFNYRLLLPQPHRCTRRKHAIAQGRHFSWLDAF